MSRGTTTSQGSPAPPPQIEGPAAWGVRGGVVMGVPCSSVPAQDVTAASRLSSGGSRGRAASRLACGWLREPVRLRGRDRRPARVAIPSSSLRRRGKAEEDGARDREKETGRHRSRCRRREDRQRLAGGDASMGRASARRGNVTTRPVKYRIIV
jgi:hypothetical protein